MTPYLTGEKQGEPNPQLFWRMGRNSAMRAGNWKLIRIGEKHDLAASKPGIVREMGAALKDWNAQLIAPRWPPRLSPVVPVNGENIVWDL